MDSGDVCTTLWVYLIPVNCTANMAKMVNFIVSIFYHN